MTAGQIRGFGLHPQPDLWQQWKCLHFAKPVILFECACACVCVFGGGGRDRGAGFTSEKIDNNCQNGSSLRLLGSWAPAIQFWLWKSYQDILLYYCQSSVWLFWHFSFQFPPLCHHHLCDLAWFYHFFFLIWGIGRSGLLRYNLFIFFAI